MIPPVYFWGKIAYKTICCRPTMPRYCFWLL